MTEITLKLTFEELKIIDKFVELNDETRPLFDKIRNAYPKPETLLDVIRNLGYSYDCCYEIVDAVEEFEKSKEPEENEWKSVALRFGEKLSGYLSDGYYELSPAAWFRWAVFTYGNTANEYLKLLEKERAKAKAQKPEKWDIKVETDYLTGKARHKWNIVDKDGNDYKPTPQTPEETAEGLRNAMRQAKKEGVFDEPTKPMNEVLDRLENKYENDDVVNRMLKKWEENPPDFLRFQLGKSLEDRIYKWWETCFVHHTEWSMEECVEDLLDIITLFLPGEQNSEGTQNIDTVVAVEGFNDCLNKIKSKLRNKKDT